MNTNSMESSTDFSPAFATAAETAAAIRERTISATELLDLTLQRIDRHNAKLNAIVWHLREQANPFSVFIRVRACWSRQ